MKNEKQAFWDSYSDTFNSIYGTKNTLFNRCINNLFRKSMKLRFFEILNRIPESAQSVLDIGCGPGHYCINLAKKNIPVIRGIDFSREMIELAVINSKKEKVDDTINFSICDFSKFQTEDKYEYSIMMGFIEYFENPDEIIRKAIDATTKKLFISFPKKGGFLAWQRQIRYKKRCYLKLYSRNELENLLKNIGGKSFLIENMDRDFFVTITI